MEAIKIKVPESWEEISLRKYVEINQILIENPRLRSIEIISIMADCDPDILKDTDSESLNKILDLLEWSKTPPTNNYKVDLEIKENKYFLVELKSLSNGEWADLDILSENHAENIHKIMAILYRPKDEKYNTKSSAERAELFLDEVKISDVFGTQVFFSLIGMEFTKNINRYIENPMN